MSAKKYFLLNLILALLFAGENLQASSTYWFTGKVLSSAVANGNGSDAPKYSSVTIVRDNVPGEFAVQLAGPDNTDPTRIFSPLHTPAYFLTDTGSQWPSAVSIGQAALAVVETMAPNHDWSGQAYAGAVSGTVTKGQLVTGIVNMPDLWLSMIPIPTLGSASSSHISLSITSFNDLGGQALDLSVWRRSSGTLPWQWQGSVANPVSPSSAVWNDLSVTPQNTYEYAISVDFSWPGGTGAGSLSNTTGVYSTAARAIAGPFEASVRQPAAKPGPAGPTPTPMPLPGGWLAYPNPVHGDTLLVAFDAAKPGSYQIRAFTLRGDLALSVSGSIAKAGRTTRTLSIPRLASGIYLIKIDLQGSDGSTQNYPLGKVAVLK